MVIPPHCHSMEWHCDCSWGGFQGMALWVAHGDTTNGHSMECHWDFSCGLAWNASMSSSWGSTNGQSMECHWGPIIGGFHGMALWLAHGDQPMAFHGMALGLLWGPPWNGSMGSSWGSANALLSLAHGDTTPLPFHGMAL